MAIIPWVCPASFRRVRQWVARRRKAREVRRDPWAAAGSFHPALVSDHLTPAIAVLADSFTEDDFAIDCDGCTACCRGHDGVKLDDHELHDYECHQDAKGEWRVDVDDEGRCVYLGELAKGAEGCTIHGSAPRRCQEFDCRAAVITYSRVGIDELVSQGALPMAVVEMGRKKLDEWNTQMNVRALSGGANLTFLMEDDDASA